LSANCILFVSKFYIQPPLVPGSSKENGQNAHKTAENSPALPAAIAGLRIAQTYAVNGTFPGSPHTVIAGAVGRNVISPSDELFFLLEGQVVIGRNGSWRVEVCGVYSTDTERWVQLNLSGTYPCGVTLRAGCLDASGVVALLASWLDDTLSADLEPFIVSQAHRADVCWLQSESGSSSSSFVM
jgi:hypothetical protein